MTMTSLDKRIPKRVTNALFNSLGAGVTPRVGLEVLVVGRVPETNALLDDLDNVADGGAAFRIITGRYGSGKSFLLQLLRNYAMERDYVVTDVDLSPERRLTGSKGQGLATYRGLLANLATKVRPDGGALPVLMDRWIDNLQQEAMKEGLAADSAALHQHVETAIHAAVGELETLVHGFDFAKIVTHYYRASRTGDDDVRRNVLRWLRAEYTSKTDARQDLGVRVIIGDDNWYDYLKLIAEFVVLAGYKGLLTIVDEAVNLKKISHRVSRTNNYEKLLTILNDCLQGKARHLAFFMAGTPGLLEDERRGLYSYEALKSRLQTSRFNTKDHRDLTSPVVHLDPLGMEELVALTRRVRDLHALHNKYENEVPDADLIAYLEHALNQPGAEEFITPRSILRDLITLLNLAHQHEERTFRSFLEDDGFTLSRDREVETSEDPVDEEFAEIEI